MQDIIRILHLNVNYVRSRRDVLKLRKQITQHRIDKLREGREEAAIERRKSIEEDLDECVHETLKQKLIQGLEQIRAYEKRKRAGQMLEAGYLTEDMIASEVGISGGEVRKIKEENEKAKTGQNR